MHRPIDAAAIIHHRHFRLPRTRKMNLLPVVGSLPISHVTSEDHLVFVGLEYKASKANPFYSTMLTVSGLCTPQQALSACTHFRAKSKKKWHTLSECDWRSTSGGIFLVNPLLRVPTPFFWAFSVSGDSSSSNRLIVFIPLPT